MRFLRSLLGRAGQRGQSVVEALVAVAVLGIAAQGTALVVRAMAVQNISNRDRIFATEKALQMLEELRELVLTQNATLTTLDTYADTRSAGPNYVPVYRWTLTTKTNVFNNQTGLDWQSAADPRSANPVRTHGYAFCRHVDVWSTTADANVRMIYVRVYAASANPGAVSSTQTAMALNPGQAPLAEVYGMVHSLGSVAPPSQVLDLYFVGLENVPGWWNRTSNSIPLMQSSVVSLQAMNPGLVIRSHWIQTLSYGRDLEYTPEINAEGTVATATGAFKKAYVYPGYVGYDNGDDYYYLPSWFLGRVNVGGVLPGIPGVGGWPNDMTYPNQGYAIADQFNHAMRYPDEQNLYNVLCQIADNNGVAEPQVSWRMLLEKLNEGDVSMQNAVILNLHGELVPVPPLRNYSDAAKDPQWYQDQWTLAPFNKPARAYRAVTQPEQLWYNTAATCAAPANPAVNVYAYDANPSEITADYAPGEVVDNITLYVPNANLSNLYEIDRIQGNSAVPYYRRIYGGPNGYLTYYCPLGSTYTAITDSPGYSQSSATFWADVYSPPGRGGAGLRIQLYGTTPTARVYSGEAQCWNCAPGAATPTPCPYNPCP